MIDNKENVYSFIQDFTKKHGYTPTSYLIAEELYLPHEKVSSIIDALKAEGSIKIHRPLS